VGVKGASGWLLSSVSIISCHCWVELLAMTGRGGETMNKPICLVAMSLTAMWHWVHCQQQEWGDRVVLTHLSWHNHSNVNSDNSCV
jgi:hypothetical protein